MSLTTKQRWKVWLLVIGFFTAAGLLGFGYRYFDDLAREKAGTFSRRLIEELTGAYCAAVLFPFIVKFARRFRLQKQNWLRRMPAHLLAMVVFSILHTSLIALSRDVIFPAAGLGSYDYGIMVVRYLMEFFNDVVVYWSFVAFIYLFDHYRESRDRELKTSQLETRLAQAQLQSLRLQLQPHFLFNALNTISAMIYENPRAADEMIARLSELLRLSLRHSGSQEVTLQEELDFLNLYLEIMRARFEERLAVTIEVEPEVRGALVPQLLLQPLVENSIRHAVDPESGAVAIDVRAKREAEALLLEVSDNGPGLNNNQLAVNGNGIGLANTQRRLDQLYGAAHDFRLANAASGGLVVRVKVPFHTSPNGHALEGESQDGEDSRDDR